MEAVLNNNDMGESLQTRVAILEKEHIASMALLNEIKTEVKKLNDSRYMMVGAILVLQFLFNVVDIKSIFLKP